MTIFDYAAVVVLLVSGLAGMVRGATREISTVVALVAAATVAASTLRFTGPLAGRMIHTEWIANTAAVLCVFVLTYIVLRLIGGALTRGVQQTGLSGLDRLLGLGIGAVRALVVLGGFVLLVRAVTPPERMPAWVSDAKLYPLASASGDALKAFAPRGVKVAQDMAPGLAGPSEPDPATDATNIQSLSHHRTTGDGTGDHRPSSDDKAEETP
jgi:membrane protein required for colicin V production